MRVHVEVYGCAVTQAEGATVRALLTEAGHELVDALEGADDVGSGGSGLPTPHGADAAGSGGSGLPTPHGVDAAVLVTCTVVNRTERNMTRRMRELAETVDTLVVTGCMASAQAEKIVDVAPRALVLPPRHVSEIVPLLEEGRWTPARVDKAGLPRVLDGGIATIVVNDGCLSSCAFCITKLARPGLASYARDAIVDAVADAARAGAVEVRLTSMDTGAWGRERKETLPDLLRAVAEVPGDHRVRLGMLNPFLGLPFLDALLETMRHERFFKFLHLPVQSGSDPVLKAMGRHHSADDFRRIVRRAREVLGEDVTISTDVIAGYPTETEDDHAATLALLEDVRPTLVNVTRFSPRPFTPAAELPPLDGGVVKRRSGELAAMRERLTTDAHAACVGRTVDCVVTEHVKAGSSQARTAAYLPVVVNGELPVGTRLRVRVTGAAFPHVTGTVLERVPPRSVGPAPASE